MIGAAQFNFGCWIVATAFTYTNFLSVSVYAKARKHLGKHPGKSISFNHVFRERSGLRDFKIMKQKLADNILVAALIK